MVDKAYELKEDIENIDKSLSNTTKALLEEKNKISKRIKLYERIRDNKDANIDFHQKIADAIILENTGVENFNL